MDARNELKGKRGLVRLLNATRYSLAGYKAAWQDEEAFRQICLLAVIGLPLACWLGRDWTESVLAQQDGIREQAAQEGHNGPSVNVHFQQLKVQRLHLHQCQL